MALADDRVHLQVAEALALLHHGGPLFDIHPAHDDAPAVLGRSALAVALAACAQVHMQRPASLLVLPHMLVDGLVGDHVAALALCQAHDLLRAELLGRLPLHFGTHGSGEAHCLGLVPLALGTLARGQVGVVLPAAPIAVAPELAARRGGGLADGLDDLFLLATGLVHALYDAPLLIGDVAHSCNGSDPRTRVGRFFRSAGREGRKPLLLLKK